MHATLLVNNLSHEMTTILFSFQTQLIVSASICADVLEDFGTYSSFVYVFDTGSKPGDS